MVTVRDEEEIDKVIALVGLSEEDLDKLNSGTRAVLRADINKTPVLISFYEERTMYLFFDTKEADEYEEQLAEKLAEDSKEE